MTKKHTVRIGVKSARELELEVDDPQEVSTSFEKALKGKDSVLWITDTRDHRFGIAIDSIAFIEIERPVDRGVGFGN
jgi:hypothetical protein